MKFYAVLSLATVFVIVCSVEGRFKRKKYESDFVFAEEDENKDAKETGVKKKWIHDPESDLCVPLKCKKKELCLLENLYTAVCVSKKDLHKNGDIIMSKARYLAEEAKKKASVRDGGLDDDDDDDDDADDDDDDDYDEDMEDDFGDDDFFYDGSKPFSLKTKDSTLNENTLQKCNSCPITKPLFLCGSDNFTYSSLCRLDYHNCVHRSSIKVSCKGFCPCKAFVKSLYVSELENDPPPCDMSKSQLPYCFCSEDGTGMLNDLPPKDTFDNALNNNNRYFQLFKDNFLIVVNNKITKKNDQVEDGLSFGKSKYASVDSGSSSSSSSNVEKPKSKKSENNKVPAHPSSVDKYSLVPEDFKYENKHYKYIKYTKNDPANTYKFWPASTKTPYYYNNDKERMRGDNEVIDEKSKPLVKPWKWSKCPEGALQSMGNRLLDWFSVIMVDSKRRRTDYKGKALVFPKGCKMEVGWMFKHLDLDADGQLTLQELYDLEHDQNEHCIKPFLDMCDTNRDIFVSPSEWCHCFTKSERPCAAVKKRIPQHVMPGVYVPMCDDEGYYQSMQCHGATGMCWCVNKHGVEFSNSRMHGKVDCALYFLTGGSVTEKSSTAAKKFDSSKSFTNDFGTGSSRNGNNNDTNDNDDDEDDDDDSEDDDDFNGSGDRPLIF